MTLGAEQERKLKTTRNTGNTIGYFILILYFHILAQHATFLLLIFFQEQLIDRTASRLTEKENKS